MDRSLWKREFTSPGALPWPCSYCGASRPKIVAKSVAESETRDSARARDDGDWEPEWIEGRFSLLATCDDCKGSVGLTGKYRISDDRFLDPEGATVDEWGTHYTPFWFSEAPQIIAIPKGTPDTVADEIRASFQVYWGDRFSCANRIRAAVESLLTSERIPKTEKKVGGKRKFLPLHRRIELFRAKQPDLADKLMAIKWVGNAGSHSADLDADDLLDGYEILSFVLEDLYVGSARRVERIAKTINKRRAPRSRRRGPK